MEPKAEELYEDGWYVVHIQDHLFRMMDGCSWFESIQKPAMFWKQSRGFKGSFRIRGPVQTNNKEQSL